MKFNLGQLVSVKHEYVSNDEPTTGFIIESIYAREHNIKAVRDVSELPENKDLSVVRVMFHDGHSSEFFDDEVTEMCEDV